MEVTLTLTTSEARQVRHVLADTLGFLKQAGQTNDTLRSAAAKLLAGLEAAS